MRRIKNSRARGDDLGASSELPKHDYRCKETIQRAVTQYSESSEPVADLNLNAHIFRGKSLVAAEVFRPLSHSLPVHTMSSDASSSRNDSDGSDYGSPRASSAALPAFDPPQKTFSQLGVEPFLCKALQAMSIRQPTGVQAACIPPILAGKVSHSYCAPSLHRAHPFLPQGPTALDRLKPVQVKRSLSPYPSCKLWPRIRTVCSLSCSLPLGELPALAAQHSGPFSGLM